MNTSRRFGGAKVALFLGSRLLVLHRDDIPTIPWPGYWDLPGGGREGYETPQACVRRECLEETGLDVPRHAFIWQRGFRTRGSMNWFFVARLPASALQRVQLGSEGQRLALMSVAAYLAHPKAIPRFKQRLRVAMKGR